MTCAPVGKQEAMMRNRGLISMLGVVLGVGLAAGNAAAFSVSYEIGGHYT